jgi:hypothetical protein
LRESGFFRRMLQHDFKVRSNGQRIVHCSG